MASQVGKAKPLRHGWIDGFNLGQRRELNKLEQSRYEAYCEYCRMRIGCEPAVDYFWYTVNNTLPSV